VSATLWTSSRLLPCIAYETIRRTEEQDRECCYEKEKNLRLGGSVAHLEELESRHPQIERNGQGRICRAPGATGHHVYLGQVLEGADDAGEDVEKNNGMESPRFSGQVNAWVFLPGSVPPFELQPVRAACLHPPAFWRSSGQGVRRRSLSPPDQRCRLPVEWDLAIQWDGQGDPPTLWAPRIPGQVPPSAPISFRSEVRRQST